LSIALNLFSAFTLREIRSRYSGSVLGLAWAFIGPLAMLLIYAFVFGHILKPGQTDLGAPSYILFLGAALWPWMMFSDGLLRGMGAIKANASLVRKVAFPHSVLVLSAVGATVALHLAGYIAVLAVLAYIYGGISLVGIPAALLVLVAVLVFTLGLALLLAALHTLLPDIEQATQPLLMMLYFLTPVLYPQSVIPLPYREWFNWNPLALMIQRLREHLFGQPALNFTDLVIWAVALLSFAVGYAVFIRLSPHFEDFV
jgi:lipopolysaccharide transport system permease protein